MACNFIYDLESRSPTPESKSELNDLWTFDTDLSDDVRSSVVDHRLAEHSHATRTSEELQREIMQHYFNISLIPRRDRFPFVNLKITDSLIQRKMNRLLYLQTITQFLSSSHHVTYLSKTTDSDSTCETPDVASELLTSTYSHFPLRRKRLGVIYSSDSET